MKHEDSHPSVIGYETHFVIWLGLLVLTAMTVLVAGMNLHGLSVFVALAVAAAKCTLVCLYFMHLKHESLVVQRVFIITVFFLASFIAFTYIEVFFRGGV